MARRRIGQAAAVLVVLLGAALLALPFAQTYELPAGLVSDHALHFTCEAPVVDAFRPEPDGWLNYAPDGSPVGPNRLSGSVCMPESAQRGMAGTTLVMLGVALLVIPPIVRRRRARQTARPVPAPA